MDLSYDEFIKNKHQIDKASGFDVDTTHPALFDFQHEIVKWACKRGRAAIFADTGLGKTAMQVVWSQLVSAKTDCNVLIVAPLCVAQQTITEAAIFDVDVKYCRNQKDVNQRISITNYEMLDHFDAFEFGAIVLDESSILKHRDSKTRKKVIDMFGRIPYRLSCTATPSPNDFMELGNQSEFLGIMSQSEMLAMFFIHDGGSAQDWRLKRHGQSKFWEWMASWAVCIKRPSDLGFDDSRFNLPDLNIIDHVINDDNVLEGELFPRIATTLTERRIAKKKTIIERCNTIADIVNKSKDRWLIWCHLNDESSMLADIIHDAVEVNGSMSIESKSMAINGFTNGEIRVLVTKPSIAGFGMNWQHCHKMAFVGLNDSFEQYYQAIRRCWRFGQTNNVDVYLISAASEGAVKQNIERKQKQAETLSDGMVEHMRVLTKNQIKGAIMDRSEYKESVEIDVDNQWELHNADCVEAIKKIDDSSIDYTIFSPPFASLYIYSNSERDMGNSRDNSEFLAQFKYLVDEMIRTTKPGRLLSFHCMNLPTLKSRDGFIGITDFRGELIRLFCDAGWIYHSEVVIWKDPVVAMQRTKAIGLLYKQLRKDSCISRQGIPDYLVTMRKPGDNPDPVTKTHDGFPVQKWQKYASPVWMDINPSDTLQFKNAKTDQDERHICPLQLQVISRAIELWTNPGDLVCSPFAGIGSEGYVSLKMDRRFIGIELKESYYNVAIKNLKSAKGSQGELLLHEAS